MHNTKALVCLCNIKKEALLRASFLLAARLTSYMF